MNKTCASSANLSELQCSFMFYTRMIHSYLELIENINKTKKFLTSNFDMKDVGEISVI